jgi:outer membrane protein TolC
LQESDPLAFEAAYLRNSHELGMARSEWQRTQALAEKAAAARTPEPTVGLYAGSERGGNERIVGLQLSMPFGGTARSAQHEALLAEAQAAEWRLRDVESRLRAEFRSQWAQAQALSAGAQALDSASRAQNLSAARMQRAYALGEASLADGLNTRRVALQTLRDALTARFDAAYAAARLRLDAHALWAGGGMNAEHAH